MIRTRFVLRLFLGCGVLVLFTAALVGLLVRSEVSQESEAAMERALAEKAALLRALLPGGLFDGGVPDLQERVRSLAEAGGVRVTLIRADGRVVADSARDPATMDDHGGREEVAAALQSGHGAATRRSATLGEEMKYHALRVGDGHASRGVVRVALPLTQITQRLGDVRLKVLTGAGVAILLSLLAGYVFARRVTRPLTRMTEVAESIAQGSYERRVQTRRVDEVGRLARSFNAMAATLQQRMRSITEDRNRLLAIFSSMVEGVVAVDRDEVVVHVNDVATRMLRPSMSPCVGRTIQEVTRLDEVREILGRALERAEEVAGQARIPHRPHDLVLDMHASPLRDAEGRLVGAVAVLHDVTALHRLEQVRRDFVANVSHELKTPLTAISGLVETLIEDPEMEADTRERFLLKMRRQTDRLSSLVRDLLTLSRVESGQGILERRELDLRDTVSESCRALASAAEERDVAVQMELPDDAVLVLADGEALRQIADNLVDNAIKYTPRGGRVSVRVVTSSRHAWIEVQDTGIGIEPRHQERIFERFYRVDRARSRELGGTGLGLSIVKHLVQAHDGEIEVRSMAGEGSTFRVKLPLSDPASRPPARASARR